MGLTKQYLRTAPGPIFGIIASANANALFLNIRGSTGRFLASPAGENIIIWDTRTIEKVMTLYGAKCSVSVIACPSDFKHLAVGYADGTVKLFRLDTGECVVTFSGHKSTVACLAYDHNGMKLVSGGKDTEIVIWDVVSESGMFRLRGHKDVVTACYFMKHKNVLISSSKDTFIKFWDLDTQHCFKTVTGHRSEVWDFVIFQDDKKLITGAGDSELRLWNITFHEKCDTGSENELAKKSRGREGGEIREEGDENDELSPLSCDKIGTVMRQSKSRVLSLAIDSSETVLGCHGSDNMLELFRLLTIEEVEKKLQKKRRKERKRLQKFSEESEVQDAKDLNVTATVIDEIQRLVPIRTKGKIKAFDILLEKENLLKLIILLNNNSLELYQLNIEQKKGESSLFTSIKVPGHRTDVHTLSFSSDSLAIMSASGDSVKIWNRSSQQCIRTMPCEYALCSCFAPGDRHCIIGTKAGTLQIFDISSGMLLESIEAHSSSLRSICLSPDQHGFVSGGEDKDVKFWNFELIKDIDYSETSKRLTAVHTRTLKMSEDILCVKFSPNMKLLAVSLLDSTVKIFFVDTLKFFLSLYGHKFPVICMDISYDSTIIATGSDDRNIKIWGLDFGDCHKSIFAHDDSITCLQFIPKTHMLFTGSKDKKLKQWDADNFQKIITLEGHQSEIWALEISPDGRHIVSASHDKSIRLWEKTQEPLVLEEEQEMEREAEYAKSVLTETEAVIPGETNKETGLASRRTIETIKSAEQLMEAIDVYKDQMMKLDEHKEECTATGKELPLPTHILMKAYNTDCPVRFMSEILRRVKSSELEETLIVLPFNYVIDLLKILSTLLEREWDVELVCRCAFFLLRVHCGQVTTTHSLFPVIEKLRNLAVSTINEMQDVMGFNLAGLQCLQREIDAQEEVTLFSDATERFRQKQKARRKRERAILTVN